MSFISVCGLKEVKSSSSADDITTTEDEQEREPFYRQIFLQLRLLLRFSMAEDVYNLCYCGLYVSEMGYLLSFVFINAWTSQFFVDHTDGLSKAMNLSETITTTSMFIGLILGLALGHIIDRCAIICIFLICYLTRAAGLMIMTCVITDFERQTGLLYCSFFAMTSGTFCQTIVSQSLLNKRMIAPTREIMNGMGQACRALGIMTTTGLGAALS